MTDDEGVLALLADCYRCGTPFLSNPETVVSVSVCVECRIPGRVHHPTCSQAMESVRKPLCKPCVDVLNGQRVRIGLSPIVVIPGAYLEEE